MSRTERRQLGTTSTYYVASETIRKKNQNVNVGVEDLAYDARVRPNYASRATYMYVQLHVNDNMHARQCPVTLPRFNTNGNFSLR